MQPRHRSLLSCDGGLALMEFALVFPLLAMLLLGTIEMTRYTVLNQKLDKVATSMADFVTQSSGVSHTNLQNFAQAAPEIMKPFSFSGTIVFSSVSLFPNGVGACTGVNVPCINWQDRAGGLTASQIGTPGGNATLPGGYTIIENQNVIVAETYLSYAPLLSATATIIPSLAPHTLYKFAVFKPRQGTLTTLNPN
jgi:Flp pilus assembly protein TadG